MTGYNSEQRKKYNRSCIPEDFLRSVRARPDVEFLAGVV